MAIACQGGGSHTAFTAGVLSRLLDGDELDEYEIVGLSGTSGGAVCALMAWTALREGDRRKARALLDGFWTDNSATTPVDAAANFWLLWASTLQSAGFLPAVSPYDLPTAGLDHFRDLLTRRVDFDRIVADPPGTHPLLLVGAVDVLSGQFHAFNSWREQIVPDMVLASAAIPTVFPTIHVAGGAYWDGLFSQNPPVHDLLESRPDELWVIQINPTARADEPKTVLDITDRRNELAGNLSLYQELHGIEVIDRLLASGQLVGDRYKHVTVRILEFARPRSSLRLGPISKLNRDGKYIRELMALGEQQAEEFLAVLSVRSGLAVRRHRRGARRARPRRRARLNRTVPAPRRPARRARPRRRRGAVQRGEAGPHPQAAHSRTRHVDGPAGRRTRPPRPDRGGDRRRPRDATAAGSLVTGTPATGRS